MVALGKYFTTQMLAVLTFYRWAVVEAMMQHINPERAHFNKKCVGVEPSKIDPSRSVLKFADGTTAEADAVLGADGINSGTRGAVTGKDSSASVVFASEVAYRCLIPLDQARAGGVKMDFSLPLCFVGINKVRTIPVIRIYGTERVSACDCVSYRWRQTGAYDPLCYCRGELADCKQINIAAFKADRTAKFGSVQLPPDQPTVVPVSMEEFLTTFEDCGGDLLRLMACAAKPNKWFMHVVYPPLETYAKGRVALLGDAVSTS